MNETDIIINKLENNLNIKFEKWERGTKIISGKSY
jgi:hypothetical protein